MYPERLRLDVGWCSVRPTTYRGNRRSEVAARRWRRFGVRKPNVFRIRQPFCLAASKRIPTILAVVSPQRVLPPRGSGGFPNRSRIHGRDGLLIQSRERVENLHESANLRRTLLMDCAADASRRTNTGSESRVHVEREKVTFRRWRVSSKAGIGVAPRVDPHDPQEARMRKKRYAATRFAGPHESKEI